MPDNLPVDVTGCLQAPCLFNVDGLNYASTHVRELFIDSIHDSVWLVNVFFNIFAKNIKPPEAA